ncbi:SusC/RagA family TonB-linked outer membrane protein [Chitinophaga rhizophila]|uniref:SusC/RagA family TonB-linked outer membrane protein n=1 Tax=Chitinophaga rhizophila TaxID=2866212 RepID=A0ABS7G9K3_9BACT|nr:SusC/RagA family TonB-linked outer membrane protein [Chitinophaga rhizophila]MBW8683474.1 SusC/RagA family TonB-linked outer membrane protein [Chitinophaga rhizophila]
MSYSTHWTILMRSIILFHFATTIFITSKLYAQTSQVNERITINKSRTPLKDILEDITKQTGIHFMGSGNDINLYKLTSISVKNANLNNVLNQLFPLDKMSWTLSNNTVTIAIREANDSKSNIQIAEKAIDSTHTVTGKIVSAKGEPLVGVTITDLNKRNGTTSGENGFFILRNVSENSVLRISSVSYIQQDIVIRKKTNIGVIILKDSIGILDEVVVIPYGVASKKLTIGTVTSISSEKIEQQPVTNSLYALQGRVPGLEIMPTTGLSGGAVTLQIRGKNSLNSLSRPLILVDGVPIPANISGLGFKGANLQELSSLSYLNPSDIESISVFRDADATSIYGSRGANGVISITTKKGKTGDAKINVRVQYGISDMNRRMKMMNTADYLKLRKEAIKNSNIDVSMPPFNSDYYILNHFGDVNIWDSTRYTDWQEELLGGTARYTDLQASLSGGVPTIQYTISGNFHRETTVFAGNNSDKRGGVHFSLTGCTNNRKIQATFTSSYQVNQSTLPGIDFTEQSLYLPPNAPSLYDKDGKLNWEQMPNGARTWDNPYSELSKKYESNINNLLANLDLSYKPIQYLVFKIQAGYNKLTGNSFRKTFPFAGRQPELLGANANASFNRNGMNNFSIEPQISYERQFGAQNISLLIGASYQITDQNSETIDGQGVTSDALLKNLSAFNVTYTRNASSNYKYAAIFGRISYNLYRKYLLNISARRDGSSRFGPGRRFGNFGSIGAGWIISDETFITHVKPILSYAKLRITYGTSGNDGIGDYNYFERFAIVGASRPYQETRGFESQGIFNRYYAWETTRKLEGGLDLNFLNDRLSTSISLYRNRSNNQLIFYPYPSIVGPGGAVANLPALIQNTGIEIVFTSRNMSTSKFSWTTSINFTRNRNKLLKHPDSESSPYYASAVGRPFYGEQFTYLSAKKVDPQTGKYQFIDKSGKVVDDPYDPNDPRGGQYYATFVAPKFYGGISNTITYKRLTLDFLFQFTKQTGVNPISTFVNIVGQKKNVPQVFNDRWKKVGDVATYQKVYSNNSPFEYIISHYNYGGSNISLTDASFLRLKNISLSYNLPALLLARARISDCSLFVQGQNLLTFTKYNGLDPETQSIMSLPPLRTLIAGVKMSF